MQNKQLVTVQIHAAVTLVVKKLNSQHGLF